jgi:hypothetical protein
VTEPCGAPHPEVAGVTCSKKQDRCFEKHHAVHHPEGSIEGVPLVWDNPRQRPAKSPKEGRVKEMASAGVKGGTAGPPRAVWQGKGSEGLHDALRRVDAGSDENFKEEAKALVRTVAGQQEFLTTEDVLDRMHYTTPDNRAMGPIMLWAKSQGIIAKTEPERFVPSKYPDRHLADLRVWRSLIYKT